VEGFNWKKKKPDSWTEKKKEKRIEKEEYFLIN
jgi:hypothetical protein